MLLDKVGSILTYVVALTFLVLGVYYFTKPSFTPYHSQALSMEWNELEVNMQYVILALMKGVGGFMTITWLAIVFMQIKFNNDRVMWIATFILVLGTLAVATTLYAMFFLKRHTAGNPPFFLSILMQIILILGYLLNRRLAFRAA